MFTMIARARVPHKRERSGGARRPAQRLLDLRRVSLGLHTAKDAFDAALAVDHERRAEDTHVFAAEHRLLAPDAVRFGNFVIRVGQEREWQVELLLEFLM